MRKIYSKVLPLVVALLITLNATSIIESAPRETQETLTNASATLESVIYQLNFVGGGSGQGQF